MPEKHLFEYAVIRVVPRVEREEFLNVGVIIFAKSLKFLQMKYEVNRQKLLNFSDKLDIAEIEEYLKAYEQISVGTAESGPIGKLDQPSRFRWLLMRTSRACNSFCRSAISASTTRF